MRDVLKVRGVSGMAINFFGVKKDLRVSIQGINTKHGNNVKTIARELAPYDTGLLYRSIIYRLTNSGLIVEILCDPDVFAEEGEPYYADDVEFGTYTNLAQPFLFPAWEADRPYYEADVSAAMKAAFKKNARP